MYLTKPDPHDRYVRVHSLFNQMYHDKTGESADCTRKQINIFREKPPRPLVSYTSYVDPSSICFLLLVSLYLLDHLLEPASPLNCCRTIFDY